MWHSDRARDTFWRDLISRFNPRLRAYCRSLCPSDDQIEELLWDIWAEAAAHEPALAAASDQWPVLHVIARRVCAMQAKVGRRECPLNHDVPTEAEDDSRDAVDNQRLLRAWIDHLLDELPQQQRAAVDYRYRWNWPYWAVAAALDVEEPTARVHVTRGLRRLRTLAKQASSQPNY